MKFLNASLFSSDHGIVGRNRLGLAILLFCVAAVALAAAPSPDLSIGTGDVRIVANDSGGYDLFVRAKPDIASILLVETTQDPAMRADNFAYRATGWNPVNGNEKRMLNGEFLYSKWARFSLVSSTPVDDPQFGRAFHILIPPVLVYGYSWSRSGSVSVGNGTFFNLRTFSKPYADYSGAFADNPYRISIATRPQAILPAVVPPPAPVALPPTPPSPVAPAPSAPMELPPPSPPAAPAAAPPPAPPVTVAPQPPLLDGPPSARIDDALKDEKGDSLDLVLCLDTTSSMAPYMDDLKKNLTKLVAARVAKFKEFRVGIVLYRDYWPDEYITQKIPFTSDLSRFDSSIQSSKAYGGGDIPEASNEALLDAATQFDWQAKSRLVILVTDAAPHPEPKGNVMWIDAAKALANHHLALDPVIVPVVGAVQ